MTRREASSVRHGSEAAQDSGFTLVEVLVAIGLFTLVGSLLLGLGLSTARVGSDTERIVRLDEEARLALERLGREVRQATRISVSTADRRASGAYRAFEVTVNFDQSLDVDAVPETLEYRWYNQPANERYQQLTLAPVPKIDEETALLAATVVDFSVRPMSSHWEFDGTDGDAADGRTTLAEIDAAKNDDNVPDAPELEYVDLLDVSITVADGPFRRTHSTQIYLRNAVTR